MHPRTARSVERRFGFGLKTGNYTVRRIDYAKFTVNFAKMHLRCKMNSPFRPRSQNGRRRDHHASRRGDACICLSGARAFTVCLVRRSDLNLNLVLLQDNLYSFKCQFLSVIIIVRRSPAGTNHAPTEHAAADDGRAGGHLPSGPVYTQLMPLGRRDKAIFSLKSGPTASFSLSYTLL